MKRILLVGLVMGSLVACSQNEGASINSPQPPLSTTEETFPTSTLTLTPSPTATLTATPTAFVYSLELDDDYTAGPLMFNAASAHQHIGYLASDELGGRLTGTEGGLAAGEYIAEQFKAYGLEPGGINGSYFQSFVTQIDVHVDQPVLSIFSTSEYSYITHDDYSPRIGRYRGNGEAIDEVVWLGDCQPSAFNNNLEGKIALCWLLFGQDLISAVDKSLGSRMGGLLMITEDDPPYLRSGYGYGEQTDLPVFTISTAVTMDLLEGSGYSFEQLHGLAPGTFLGTTVQMESSYATITASGRNVLGLLPGSDPLLKDEIVIVGAHYDHVGTDPDGTIFNGANDNASGVAVIIEIARLWQTQNIQPARSVLFVAWDGEEMGWKGSYYYVSSPIYPLIDTVAYLNVDSIGVGEKLFIYGASNLVSQQLEDSADYFGFSVGFNPMEVGDARGFHDQGIRAASLMVDLDDGGYYPQLHRPEDDPEIIQLEWLHNVGALSAHTLYVWAMGN